MSRNALYSIYVMLLMTLLASCMKDPHGTLSGKITGAGGKKIYLQSLSSNPELLDSAIIGSDGSFSLIPSKALRMDYYQLFIDQKHSLFIKSGHATTVSVFPIKKIDLIAKEQKIDIANVLQTIANDMISAQVKLML